jgi:hypothetical protein
MNFQEPHSKSPAKKQAPVAQRLLVEFAFFLS